MTKIIAYTVFFIFLALFILAETSFSERIDHDNFLWGGILFFYMILIVAPLATFPVIVWIDSYLKNNKIRVGTTIILTGTILYTGLRYWYLLNFTGLNEEMKGAVYHDGILLMLFPLHFQVIAWSSISLLLLYFVVRIYYTKDKSKK